MSINARKEFALTENHLDRFDAPGLIDSKKKPSKLPIIALAISASPILFYFFIPLGSFFSSLFVLSLFSFSLGGVIAGITALWKKRLQINTIGEILSLAAIILPFILTYIAVSLYRNGVFELMG